MHSLILRKLFSGFFFKSAARPAAGVLALLLMLLPVQVTATTVVPPTFDQLVKSSEYIIRGVVKSITAEHRTNKSGKTKIYTSVEIEVREVVAGTPPEHVVLQILGGKVGDEEMRVEGTPQFHVGDEDILFVRDNGKVFYPLTAVMHGRYPVLKDKATGREFVARANQAPLLDTAEVAQPMSETAAAQSQAKSSASALTPAQFVQRIRATASSTSSTPSRLH